MIRNSQRMAAHVCALALGIASIFPAQVVLADTSAPSITHELVRNSLPEGAAYVVSATVTDDSVITEVRLLYRVLGGNPQFKAKNMEEGAAGIYKATLSAGEMVQPGVEYYITALDSSGNSQSRGFAFEPLSLNVSAPIASIGASSKTESVAKSNKTIWYLLGGVVIAGVLASLGDDSSSVEYCNPCAFGVEN